MGRPINKKFFASVATDTDGTPGLQVRLTLASFTGGPTNVLTAYLVRQRTTDSYEVTDGTNTEVLQFFNGTGSIPEGNISLRVSSFGGPTEYVRTLTAHQVKTFQGNTYSWTNLQKGNAASAPGEVDFDPTMQ